MVMLLCCMCFMFAFLHGLEIHIQGHLRLERVLLSMCLYVQHMTVKSANPFYTTAVEESRRREKRTTSEMGERLSETLPFSVSCNINNLELSKALLPAAVCLFLSASCLTKTCVKTILTRMHLDRCGWVKNIHRGHCSSENFAYAESLRYRHPLSSLFVCVDKHIYFSGGCFFSFRQHMTQRVPSKNSKFTMICEEIKLNLNYHILYVTRFYICKQLNFLFTWTY